MRERPILFSGPMVRAILSGQKTQTRRPVKDLRVRLRHEVASDLPDVLPRSAAGPGVYAAELNQHGAVAIRTASGRLLGVKPQEFDFACPYADGHTYLRKYPDGRSAWHLQIPGARLWVREAHVRGTMNGGAREWVRYRATDENDVPEGTRWKPGIHLPRAFARLVLEVADVRLERLQEITEEDARHEGFTGIGEHGLQHRGADGKRSARAQFAAAWSSMYDGSPQAWHRNPWVWVVTFRRVDAARSAA
jgi:hypothetical protein